MATKRQKKTVLSGITHEQMNVAFADYATSDAREQRITAMMDEQITKIREKYASDLKECAAKKEENFNVMQAYAMENREDLFSKKKSIETPHGQIGFRTGNPQVKKSKGFTWEAVTELLKLHLPAFVRTKEEPAKDLLIASRDDESVNCLFPQIGISIDQDEVFFIECKKEEALS